MIDYLLISFVLSCLALFIIFWPRTLLPQKLSFRKGLAFVLVLFVLIVVLSSNYFFTHTQQAIADYQQEKTYSLIVEKYLQDTKLGVENPDSIDVMVFLRSLQRYLQLNSTDSEAWFVLGNALQGVNDNQLSLMAYQRAYRVNRNDESIAIAYVNARLSLVRGGQLDTESIDVLQSILKRSPYHENALMLLGVTGFEGKDFDLAINAWEKLLVAFQKRSQRVEGKDTPENVVNALKASIDKAKANKALAKEQGSNELSASANFAVSLKLSLTERFAAILKTKFNNRVDQSEQTASTDPVLFIYARKPNQKGMPLAAIKLPLMQEQSFPVSFTLSNKNSLAGIDLSNLKSLAISARISFSGQAISKAGDWQSDILIIEKENYAKPVILEISKIVDGS
jgi:tetratricopeptide (TPR) repeat protein